MSLLCKTFYCDRRHGKFCCQDCKKGCSRRCFNTRDKCGLTTSDDEIRAGHLAALAHAREVAASRRQAKKGENGKI